MTTLMSATEIVDLAKQVEHAGEAFYRAAVEHSSDAATREIFAYLRDEEQRHARTFEELLGSLKDSMDGWREDEQYLAYLQALADRQIFPDPESAREIVKELPDDLAAIEYALGFEKDSILFLHEMRTLVDKDGREVVDRLLAEERTHVRKLAALLRVRTGG